MSWLVTFCLAAVSSSALLVGAQPVARKFTDLVFAGAANHYGAPFSHLFTELKISPIEVHISAIELEISQIELKISAIELQISPNRPI